MSAARPLSVLGAAKIGALSLALALTACGQSSAESDANGAAASNAYETDWDMAKGSPDAPVTLIEYASYTCGHCATFHETIWPQIKENYVDTGKVRFIFRQFPTPPAQLAAAQELIARCAGEDKYFAMHDIIFRNQLQTMEIIQADGSPRRALVNLGAEAGMTETQVEECLAVDESFKKLQAMIEHGQETYGVAGTPAFVINGERFDGNWANYETFAEALDAAGAAGATSGGAGAP